MKKTFKYILPFLVFGTISACTYDDKTKPAHEYMPDMYRSASYETYSENPNFPDSMTARMPVKGTVARGNHIYTDLDRIPYPYANTPEGYEKAGAELKSPIPATLESFARGKVLYENYCLICHGATGMGDGPVTKRNGPIPPAFTSANLQNLSEGKMYHSIHYGKNMMGSHASQLTSTERWKIIQYVKSLQRPEMTAEAVK